MCSSDLSIPRRSPARRTVTSPASVRQYTPSKTHIYPPPTADTPPHNSETYRYSVPHQALPSYHDTPVRCRSSHPASQTAGPFRNNAVSRNLTHHHPSSVATPKHLLTRRYPSHTSNCGRSTHQNVRTGHHASASTSPAETSAGEVTVFRAGLRRGMLLRFREPAKTIAEGPRTCLRLKQLGPSAITPSPAT